MKTEPILLLKHAPWSASVIYGGPDPVYRWERGDWFAEVSFSRSRDAFERVLSGEDVATVTEALVVDPDCGGIYDCSDDAVRIAADLIAVETEDADVLDLQAYREQRSRYLSYALSSGVF